MIKKTACFILFTFILISNGISQPEIYIFRHGEKLEPWNSQQFDSFQPLSEKGMKTAEKIAALFQKKSITAIYSSKTTRTLTTAWPLAQSKNLTIEFNAACSDTAAISDFINGLSSKYKPDETIVIISHSNIIPYFLFRFGASKNQVTDLEITYSQQYQSYLTNTYNSYWKISPIIKEQNRYKIERYLIE